MVSPAGAPSEARERWKGEWDKGLDCIAGGEELLKVLARAVAIGVVEGGSAGEVADGDGDGPGLVVPVAWGAVGDGYVSTCGEVKVDSELVVGD